MLSNIFQQAPELCTFANLDLQVCCVGGGGAGGRAGVARTQDPRHSQGCNKCDSRLRARA
jgi:hypothetical protein